MWDSEKVVVIFSLLEHYLFAHEIPFVFYFDWLIADLMIRWHPLHRLAQYDHQSSEQYHLFLVLIGCCVILVQQQRHSRVRDVLPCSQDEKIPAPYQ